MTLFVGPWQQRKPARIGLDLRWRSQVHAVAVDLEGRPIRWLTQDRSEGDFEAALDLVRQLRPGDAQVRVLLSEPTVQTTWIHGVHEPDPDQIQEALLGDGYPPLAAPMVASLDLGNQRWLTSACDGDTVAPLLDGLASLGVRRIEWVADSMLIAQRLNDDEVIMEAVDDRLLLAARPAQGEAVLRSLNGPVEHTFQDVLVELSALDTCQVAHVLGASRQSLAINLRGAGLATVTEPLPWNDSGALAMPHETAWLLATASAPPTLRSPQSDRMTLHLAWSRRLRHGAVAGGVMGVLLMLFTLGATWSSRESLQEQRLQQKALHAELAQVQDLAVQVEGIRTLRVELEGQRVPWPPVAPLLTELATALPDGATFEHLQITEAGLELRAWAPASGYEALFRNLRARLAAIPQLSNLSWKPPAPSPSRSGSVQTLSARIGLPNAVEPPRVEAPRVEVGP